jgi:hypothetical protein
MNSVEPSGWSNSSMGGGLGVEVGRRVGVAVGVNVGVGVIVAVKIGVANSDGSPLLALQPSALTEMKINASAAHLRRCSIASPV